MLKYEALLNLCTGINVVEKERIAWGGQPEIYNEYYIDGKIGVPDNTYIKIIGTATNGTIGRLVDIEPKLYDKKISTWVGTYILEIDGRKQPSRIKSGFCELLKGYTGPTKYVRNIKKHNKVKKLPINKYKQELYVGAWVFGAVGKSLRIGRVTRWTNHTAWGTMSDDLKDKSKEFKFEGVQQTFLLEDPEQVKQQLTFATLKGWKGN